LLEIINHISGDIIVTAISIPQQKNPPTTQGLPFIGSLPGILKEKVDFLLQSRERYGDIFNLDLGVTSCVMVCTPEMAQYILRDNAKNFSKGGAMWDSVRTMLGNGLVVSEGDFWLRQRRMMQPQFHRQYLSKMTELMIDAIESGMQEWDALAEAGKPVEMLHAFNRVTMKVIVQTMFGNNLSDEDGDMVGVEMAYALDFMMQNVVTKSIPAWIPVPGRKRYQTALERIDAFIYGVIEQRRQDPEEHKDMLGMMLQLVDDETGAQMTDQQVRDEIATLFLAGYETTALTLSWGIHHLTRHPEVVAKLTEEIDRVVGKQAPTFEMIPQLAYTRSVLQEIMRVHPPSFWLPRTAVEDDELNGYHIKAGQMVAVSMYNIHHNPDVWENPEVFDPERFSTENSQKRHQLAWMPFGAGQRMCLGRDFAMMEGALVMAIMMQRYHFAATEHVASIGLSSTLRPKDGVWATISKRA
jgi:cytochrome P450